MIYKQSNDWNSVNDEINLVQPKRNWFKWKKLLPLLAALLLSLSAAGTGAYFVFETMISALNFDGFKTPDIDLEGADFRVNMAEVPIISSSENLRLNYFERSLKIKAFAYISRLSWWSLFFSKNPDDFDFSWYKPKTDIKLNALDVSRDGFDPCDLVITVKSSGYSFRIPVASFVYNNAKFYENFMMFNRFETQYANVYSTLTPVTTGIANKGYLSQSYSVKSTDLPAPYNRRIYAWIKERIGIFATNESQELVSNPGELPMYPILTSIPGTLLTDVDVENPATLLPYLSLITDPDHNYYDEAGNYEEINGTSKYSIIYSPIPDLIEKLIAANITDITQLDNFLKANRLNFIPFVETNESVFAGSSIPEKYVTPHDLLFQGTNNTKELSRYFYYASNTTAIDNFKLNIDPNVDRNMAILAIYIKNILPVDLWVATLGLSNALELEYPYPSQTAQQNFNYFSSSSDSIRRYFGRAFNSTWLSVTTVKFYDEFNNVLNLPGDAPVPYNQIKHLSLSIGPDTITTPYRFNSQSFSLYFKIFWVTP